jgi:2-hydroxy-3-keto-5-methylthiopentenyl-1-phosphate phosphatase
LTTPSQPTSEEQTLLARLQARWPDIVASLRDKSAFLGSVLLAGNPIKLQDQVLSITFTARDGFHRDMLAEPEYRALVEKELSMVLQQPVTIVCQTIA